MKYKIIEWIKRYRLSEVVSYTLAIFSSWITFKITQNYYLSGLVIIIMDNLWYYWVMFLNEIRSSKKINKQYNFKLFMKDFRNLWFEFWPPQLLEIFIIYPLLVFYIPPLFDNYLVWAFIAMTLAVMIFYIQAIILYEIRKKYLN